MRSKRAMVDFIVVGIGVNINMTREEMIAQMGNVAATATSITEVLGKDVDRAKFAADLLLELESWYRALTSKGKPFILREWTARWGDLNKRVSVIIDKEQQFEGTAIGVDETGSLIVKTDAGEINKVVAGDVRTI